MLNKECEIHNSDQKVKIVERSAKKGIKISEKDVNLLELGSQIDDESSGLDSDEEHGRSKFEIKLQMLDN